MSKIDRFSLGKFSLEVDTAATAAWYERAYVCNLYDNFYQFSYRIAGNILKTPEKEDPLPGEGRCCHEAYPYGAPDFPMPYFDLEFIEQLPWVLKTGPEE